MDLVDRLADLGVKALSSQQKIVAMAVLDTLFQAAEFYGSLKRDLDPEWFTVPEWMRQSPDFATLNAHGVTSIVSSRTWFLWKILRKLQVIYNHALSDLKDVCNSVGLTSSKLGMVACDQSDPPRLTLIIKFFNTFIRYAINAREVRTVYNILQHYRAMVVHILRVTKGRLESAGAARGVAAKIEEAANARMMDQCMDIFQHFKYYARVCYEANLAFVFETIAMDLSEICAEATVLSHPKADAFIAEFLTLALDATGKVSGDKIAVPVTKVQARLVARLGAMGFGGSIVQRVAPDFAEAEEAVVIEAFRAFLYSVKTEFWEVNDRGTNFDYLSRKEKTILAKFFAKSPHAPAIIAKFASSAPVSPLPSEPAEALFQILVGEIERSERGSLLAPGAASLALLPPIRVTEASVQSVLNKVHPKCVGVVFVCV